MSEEAESPEVVKCQRIIHVSTAGAMTHCPRPATKIFEQFGGACDLCWPLVLSAGFKFKADVVAAGTECSSTHTH